MQKKKVFSYAKCNFTFFSFDFGVKYNISLCDSPKRSLKQNTNKTKTIQIIPSKIQVLHRICSVVLSKKQNKQKIQ